jgi:hypothetical protein
MTRKDFPHENIENMVRVGRIELPYPTWKDGVLPLNYTRITQVLRYTSD